MRRPLHANPLYSLWNLQKRCNGSVVNYQMQSLGVPFKNHASYYTSPNLFLRVCFLPQFLVTVGNLEKKNLIKVLPQMLYSGPVPPTIGTERCDGNNA